MTTVSHARTTQEFRDEIVVELRRQAEREKQAEDFGTTHRDALLAKARRITLERFAEFLASIEFHERKPELTRTADEAQLPGV